MRLFVAADPPATAREELERYGRALVQAGGWRTVKAEALHLTLAFLGERPEAEVAAIADAVRAASRPVGEVALGRALMLPPRSPRVAAVAVVDLQQRLRGLQAALSEGLAAIGAYRPERRPYLPHVTVARRTRDARGQAAEPEWTSGWFRLERVVLYRSRLSPRGASYEALAGFEL